MFDKWDRRFMELAHLVSTWASCYQPDRKIGAVIVKDKRVMTTGYNGAPAGVKTCVERGECLRKKLGIASGTVKTRLHSARKRLSHTLLVEWEGEQ